MTQPKAKLDACFLASRVIAALDDRWLDGYDYSAKDHDRVMKGIRQLVNELAKRGRLNK